MSTSGLSRKQQASSRRTTFRTVRKVLWKMVKNCVRNRSRPDEIDTETEICTSLKSEFYFLFVDHQVQSQCWLVISHLGFLWRSVEKYVHHNGKRPQFFTDFHQILHAAQKCGCLEHYCFSDKPEVVYRFQRYAKFDFGSFAIVVDIFLHGSSQKPQMRCN